MATGIFTAVVLAGSRGLSDPVAAAAGAPCKAVVSVGGRPMLLRVLAALTDSGAVDGITVVGLPEAAMGQAEVSAALARPGIQVVGGRETPVRSLVAAMAGLDEATPVLATTADHVLLRGEIVDRFLGDARGAGADVVIGLTTLAAVRAVSADTRRTVLRFRDGEYCGCNLYAFLTPRGRAAAEFWTRIEAHRKHPARVVRMLGPLTLLRYLLGILTLDGALARLSRRCGARIAAVRVPYGEAAIDVDKPDDLRQAEALLGARTQSSGFQSPISRNSP